MAVDVLVTSFAFIDELHATLHSLAVVRASLHYIFTATRAKYKLRDSGTHLLRRARRFLSYTTAARRVFAVPWNSKRCARQNGNGRRARG